MDEPQKLFAVQKHECRDWKARPAPPRPGGEQWLQVSRLSRGERGYVRVDTTAMVLALRGGAMERVAVKLTWISAHMDPSREADVTRERQAAQLAKAMPHDGRRSKSGAAARCVAGVDCNFYTEYQVGSDVSQGTGPTCAMGRHPAADGRTPPPPPPAEVAK